MCTGEVEMKVWMRPRLAGLIASAARSMSACPARESPHTTARLVRLAISCTASKSPCEAIGKPASMMSTPISSSSSATSSFSSWVMVAPGDCSPSRRVVSKMKTRSLSDLGVRMEKIPSVRLRLSGALGVFARPLSAQARAPSRPSGADKQKEAENAGSRGRGHGGRPFQMAMLETHRHGSLAAKVADRREGRVTLGPAL